MSWKPIESLYTLIVPEVPGVDEATLNQKTIEVLREFCTETHAWRLQLDPIRLVADIEDYDLDGWETANAEFDIVRDVYRGTIGADLSYKSLLEPDDDYTVPEDGIIRLASTPASSGVEEIDVVVSLKPTFTATQIDGELFNRWATGIAYGVQSRLLSMPKRRWFDMNRASQFAGAFEAKKVDARMFVINNGATQKRHHGTPRWSFI